MLRNNKIIISVVAVIIIFVLIAGTYKFKSSYRDSLQYSQEYIAGTGNIKGNVNVEYFVDISSDFKIGANPNGYAVFKNPDAAFARLKMEYKAGIDLIQKEYQLEPLSEDNYIPYKNLGWQVTTGTEQEKKQAAFVTAFMDIYENSFSKQ
jgi:hypothetical protein